MTQWIELYHGMIFFFHGEVFFLLTCPLMDDPLFDGNESDDDDFLVHCVHPPELKGITEMSGWVSSI